VFAVVVAALMPGDARLESPVTALASAPVFSENQPTVGQTFDNQGARARNSRLVVTTLNRILCGLARVFFSRVTTSPLFPSDKTIKEISWLGRIGTALIVFYDKVGVSDACSRRADGE